MDKILKYWQGHASAEILIHYWRGRNLAASSGEQLDTRPKVDHLPGRLHLCSWACTFEKPQSLPPGRFRDNPAIHQQEHGGIKTLLSTKRCTEQEGLRLLHAVTWRNPRNRIRSENKHIAKDCFPYGDIFSLDPEPSEAKQRDTCICDKTSLLLTLKNNIFYLFI